MSNLKHTFESNAQILKSQVNKYALIGLLISLAAITVATLAVAYQIAGRISIDSIIKAQSSNVALMILDATPILFMFWGQSISSVMSYKASAMVMDQTNELRIHSEGLESKFKHQTTHDITTGLPNKLLFTEKLSELIGKNEDEMLAVLIIHIDNIKELSAGFGNFNTDRVINQCTQRLKSILLESDFLARFSDDEFALVLSKVQSKKDAIEQFDDFKKIMNNAYNVDDIDIHLKAHSGLAYYPAHGSKPEQLIQRAHIAAYSAVQDSKDLTVYKSDIHKNSQNNWVMLTELRKAIEGNELMIQFQPIVEMATGEIKNCETLLYWNHPTFSTMPADKFIPIAEKAGLIQLVTHYVLDKAVETASQWRKNGLDITISVNLSAVDIIDTKFPELVEKILLKYKYPANKLKFELIESAYLSEQNIAIGVINRLSELGTRMAIDDFGTGYSSLIHLVTLPIHEVKIDKSFIIHMQDDDKKKNIVKAIIKLGKALNLTIVGEGAETIYHVNFLKDEGCTYGQGYYFSKPLSSKDFQSLVQSNSFHKELSIRPKLV